MTWVPRPCEILKRGEIGWGVYQDLVYYLCKLFINLKLFKNRNIYAKKLLPLKSGWVVGWPQKPLGTTRKQKESNPDQKGKTKTSIFDIIVYTETLKDKLLELIRLQSIAISPQT